MYDLFRILTLRPKPGLAVLLDLQCIDQAGEALPPAGHIAVLLLMIAPQIKTHDPTVIGPFQKAADTIGKIFGIDPTGPRSPTFRKNHQILPSVEKMQALLQHLLHLFPITSPTDGNTFINITQESQQKIPLKIGPLRHIPWQEIVLQNTTMHGKQGIG